MSNNISLNLFEVVTIIILFHVVTHTHTHTNHDTLISRPHSPYTTLFQTSCYLLSKRTCSLHAIWAHACTQNFAFYCLFLIHIPFAFQFPLFYHKKKYARKTIARVMWCNMFATSTFIPFIHIALLNYLNSIIFIMRKKNAI